MKARNLFLTFSLVLGLIVSPGCNSPQDHPDKPATVTQGEGQPDTLSTEERLENVRIELSAIKAQLTAEGKYNCCVQPVCNWCALHEGECKCHENIAAGEKVCPGCGLGWHNGQGAVAGIKAADVKWDVTHNHASGGHEH